VNEVLTADEQFGISIGPVFGEAKYDVLIRVIFAGIDFSKEAFSASHLVKPTPRRGKPDLLIGEFSQGLVHVAIHRYHSFAKEKSGASTEVLTPKLSLLRDAAFVRLDRGLSFPVRRFPFFFTLVIDGKSL
jgi:hypothetical protein